MRTTISSNRSTAWDEEPGTTSRASADERGTLTNEERRTKNEEPERRNSERRNSERLNRTPELTGNCLAKSHPPAPCAGAHSHFRSPSCPPFAFRHSRSAFGVPPFAFRVLVFRRSRSSFLVLRS